MLKGCSTRTVENRLYRVSVLQGENESRDLLHSNVNTSTAFSCASKHGYHARFRYCIASHCIILYRIVLYYIVLPCIVLYCIILCCMVPYCVVLYSVALHCTVLCYIVISQ